MTIMVSRPIYRGQVVLVDVFAGEASEYLRSGTFRFKYDGVDLSEINESILVLPALGAILAIAYATGVPIKVGEVDEDFAVSAEKLAKVWAGIYPTYHENGFRIIGSRIKNDTKACSRDLLLFSGGVDALASLIKNRATVGGLLSVWGADVPLSRPELWGRLQDLLPQTTATSGLDRFVVKTNLRRFMINENLVRDFTGVGQGSWWMKAQHGMALLALSAPLTAAAGFSRVIIASSHSNEFHTPWGSSPETDDLVRWGNVSAKHDAFEYTRQDKLRKLIAPHLSKGERAALAVCYKKRRGQGETINCGTCEKCIRTATGALVAGMNPVDLGLPVEREAIRAWRCAIESKEVKFGANELFMWQDIQRGFSESSFNYVDSELGAYLNWVREFDFSAVCISTSSSDT